MIRCAKRWLTLRGASSWNGCRVRRARQGDAVYNAMDDGAFVVRAHDDLIAQSWLTDCRWPSTIDRRCWQLFDLNAAAADPSYAPFASLA